MIVYLIYHTVYKTFSDYRLYTLSTINIFVGEIASAMGIGQALRKKLITKQHYQHILVPDEFKVQTAATSHDVMVEKYLATQTAEQPIYVDIPSKTLPAVVNYYLRYMLRYIFAGAFHTKYTFSPIPTESQQPRIADVDRIIQMIMSSTKPCIIISSQALLNADQAQAIRLGTVLNVDYKNLSTFIKVLRKFQLSL